MRDDWLVSDGVITIRPSRAADAATLIAGRDEEWARWLGPGSDDPRPTACVLFADTIVGWVDYDGSPAWLNPGEVNVGYNVFLPYRRRGYATRAVALLLQRLALDDECRVAILSIARGNEASRRVAERSGFRLVDDTQAELRFARSIPGRPTNV